jgi:hypothetical protein
MSFANFGLAATVFAALVSFSGNGANAAPFLPANGLTGRSDIVQAQYRDRGRHYGSPRRVCRWETVERRVRGRIIRERIERCRIVRR